MEQNNTNVNWSNKTILIVEDDRFNALVLANFIEKTKAKCLVAYNGEMGVEMAKTSNPDIILMDIKMPGIDGFEATSRIKQSNPAAIIIAQTAYATELDKDLILNSGFNDFLAKPIKFNVLINILAKYIQQA